MSVTDLSTWQALASHFETVKDREMRDLFAENPERFDEFSVTFGDLLFDYSKNRITDETKGLLLELAREAKLVETRDKMFSGNKINTTEDRAVLHVALRNRSDRPIQVDGEGRNARGGRGFGEDAALYRTGARR